MANIATPAITDKSLYQVESSWTNDVGRVIPLRQFQGRVQLVVMFFASCTYACPILVNDLQRIAAALPASAGDKVGIVLISIDPERDTPDALHSFRLARHLPAERWSLLRGSSADTLELAMLLGVKYKREANGQFSHSNLITVLNPQGEIVHQVAGLNQNVDETVKKILAAITGSSTSPPLAEQ